MWLFYTPEISGEIVTLPEEESAHCINVLRLKLGDSVTLTDGRGYFYEAVIATSTKKSVTVRVQQKKKEEVNRSYRLHIGIAPTKNISRFEWFLEKVTEIGIDEITPVITQNSERREVRTERLEKLMIAAMKQSLKASKPKLNPVISMDEFLGIRHSGHQLFIAYCGAEDKSLLKISYAAGNDAVILIGPEGDFTPAEVDMAVMKGYSTISLGNSRLRTETAGIVACHSLYLLNQK